MMESEHPTDDELARLDDGTLADGDRARIATHVSQCHDCGARHDHATASGQTVREGVAAVRPAPKPRVTALDRGTLIGRYVVVEVLGRGGMGVVYSAYDPELDRRVAIKLLQARGGSSTRDQAWLLREAQALARLAHPNVVAVHDVGTLPGDRVFVAMEHLDGDTLREWLDEPRTWREVVPIMLDAGAGLAAAHAAGLVHRDFKPENVVVGSDGRVRVMDFGLARLQGDHVASREAGLELDAKSQLTENLTRVGAVIGTPGYIAPELHDHQPAGPRSDQFAFGVTLFEALYRVRPFTDAQLQFGLATVPKPRDAPKLGVPVQLHDAALRAIAIDPEARFPSIDELLARLRPRARRRGVVIASTAIGAIAAAGITLATVKLAGGDEREPAADPCAGGEARLAGVWDADVRRRVEAAFLASRRTHAPDTFDRVAAQLDQYTQRWVGLRREVCEATEVRHEQSATALDQRMRCLGQRLDVTRALTALFAGADVAVTDNAVLAARDLPAVAECATYSLDGKPTPTPAQEPQVDAVWREFAELRATALAGKYVVAAERAKALLERARRIGYAPLTGQAMFMSAIIMMATSRNADGERMLRDTLEVAAIAKDDTLLAGVWTYLIWVVGLEPARYDEALAVRPLAQLAITRAGGGPMLQGDLEYNVAHTHLVNNQGARATAAFETAIELRGQALGERDRDLWKLYNGLAGAFLKSGNLYGAKQTFEKSLALVEQLYGPRHPGVSVPLSNLGSLEQAMNSFDQAFALHRRALVILEETYGPDHEQVATIMYSLAVSKNGLEDYAGAIPYYERALQIFAKASPDHAQVGVALVGLADCREEVGDAKRAVDEAERGLALVAKGSDPVQLALARYVLAKALWSANQQRPRARALGAEARKGFAAAGLTALHALAAVDNWFAKIDGKRR